MSDKRQMGALAAQDSYLLNRFVDGIDTITGQPVDWSRYNQPFGELKDTNPVLYQTPNGVQIRESDIGAATNAALGASGGGMTTKIIKGSAKLGDILNPDKQPLGIRAYHSSPRELPLDNYRTRIEQYAPYLYRETDPRRALEMMPGSSAAEYRPPFGGRDFYADHPDLALGQGLNRGVTMQFTSAPFEGQIHKKPGWEDLWRRGLAEYLAAPAPGESIKQALLAAEIDKTMLDRVSRPMMDRTVRNLADQGWRIDDTGKLIEVTRPKTSHRLGDLAAQDKYQP